MKKFTMVVEMDDDYQVYSDCENEGFNAGELVGILELKKQDILYQTLNEAKFKRTLHTPDGDVDISEVEE